MKIKNVLLFLIFAISATIISFIVCTKLIYNPSLNDSVYMIDENIGKKSNSFDYDIIHLVNKEEKNYLISPYSIAYALSILRDGASGNTKKQIENVLGKYILDNKYNVENRISIANALFIRNKYENDIKKEYINNIKNNYEADILFDEYKTPDKINNWVKNKTYNMIDKILNEMNEDFVLGIANAIAIDVEWNTQFIENRTSKEEFTNLDNTKSEIDFMHTDEDITYIENELAKGIIKDYKKYDNTELEFIAIMPNNNIKEYINKFNIDELNSLLNNKKSNSNDLEIHLSLPKFKFDYDYTNFKADLINMGIKDAFDSNKAKFNSIINDNSDLELYVNEAIHKTHIDLSEYGTKAAAVTYFGLYKNTALPKQKEIIDIKFNKPFLFIIKDKNSNDIWFFGTIYEQ